MKFEEITVGMKVKLLSKHCFEKFKTIESFYSEYNTSEDCMKMKAQGYGVVTKIINENKICVDHDATGTGWYFLPEDLEPYVNNHKFKVGDKVRVKNIQAGTEGSYGGIFVDDMTRYIGRIFTVAEVRIEHTENYYYHLNGTSCWCFADEWLEPVEEELLLPIGTKIRQIKPLFGEYSVFDEICEVINSDKNHIQVRQQDRGGFTINKQELEECWEIIKEKKDGWEDRWHSHGLYQYKVHSNGKKVKVKIASGDVGVAICADGDEFDLEKGINIAKNRATIKKLEKQIKKLSK